MNTNQIHDEIRAVRDAMMLRCRDVRGLSEHCRAGEARWAAQGHRVVSFAGQKPLDLPLPDWEKLDAQPENEIIAEIRAIRRKAYEECGGDLDKLFERHRAETEKLKAEGWKFVTPKPRPPKAESAVVREDPPEI